jgi:hypothetical protein
MTNEQLAQLAEHYRTSVERDSQVSFMKDSDDLQRRTELAEVYEELLDHRLRLGHAEN